MTNDRTETGYLTGFGNEHESEALPGALPVGRFSPQRLAYGLYAEQFSSTAFTAPRVHNQWMPDRTLVEPGISADTQRLLEEWGHQLSPTRRTIGRSNSLMIDEGWMQGFADMRRPGGHVATE